RPALRRPARVLRPAAAPRRAGAPRPAAQPRRPARRHPRRSRRGRLAPPPRTAGRAMLIVLDNARDAAQVWPLLPGDGPTTIVTSRDQLRGLVAGGAATRVTLRPLPEDDSLEL